MQARTQSKSLLDWQRSIQIEYLGWSKPILHSACDYLFSHHCRAQNWDLDRMLVVLPGSLAGRRLQMLLAQRAAMERVVLRPPEVLTLGKLPEKLYQAKLPFASDLEQVMAWTQVLKSMAASELQPLLFEVPSAQELGPWMDLAQILGALHRELASDLLDFADVAQKLSGTPEEARWSVLAKLQRRYLDVLHEAGLWDVQSARRFALTHQEVTEPSYQVLLIGTVDLNRAQRQFLAAIAPSVTTLIGAPIEFSEGFDADGTLRSEFWQDLEIPIPEDSLHVRSSVSEAANELAVQLAKLGESRSTAEITVGVPDPALVPTFQESLARSGVTLRYGPGIPIVNTQPMRLLAAMEEYLSHGDTASFHALIRTSRVHAWLAAEARMPTADPQAAEPVPLPPNFLALIDEYLNASLLRSVRLPRFPEFERGRREFRGVLAALDAWLQPLLVGRLPLSQWSAPLRQVLSSLYSGVSMDTADRDGNLVARACREINAALAQLAAVPSILDVAVEWREALAWLHHQLASVQVPPNRSEGAIEMIGWLELSLDDAPVLMLSGLHDGVIPESVNADAFLPNRLRSELGLIDNARRYARDAYVMMTVLHARERVEFILNRRSADGDPLTPSRLLMAVPLDRLARRVRTLLSENQQPDAYVQSWVPRPGQSNIPIPLPVLPTAVADMAVTDFKKYAECPYRFYLNRVRKLRAVPHLPLELDGGAFGDIVHNVLEAFFLSPVAESTDEKSIASWLISKFKEASSQRFGPLPPPAVVVQLEQATMRLQEFAKHHAEVIVQGWRMIEAEYTVERNHAVPLQLDKERVMKLHGRIDRIDRHDGSKKLAVWDYKTGDSSGDPRSIHVKKSGEWTDWQLPLYGLLIGEKDFGETLSVSFGYILLPRNVKETRFVTAEFTQAELGSAVESAKEIARSVMDGAFWPPSDALRPEYDDYRAITQSSVVRRWDPAIAERENSDEAQPEPVQSPQPEVAIPVPKARVRATMPSRLLLEPVLAQGESPAEWFSPAMILAAAGTGKTYRLASRALHLLFTNQPLDSVLATTFTRKAAGEILQRILQWLAEGCETEEGFTRLQSILAPLSITREVVQYQLARLCSQLHRFRVSTLDSFYSQLARTFALELKLPPGWTLLDPAQEKQLNRDAITKMFDAIETTTLHSLISQLSKGEAVRSVRDQIEQVVEGGYHLFREAESHEVWQCFQIPGAPDAKECEQALSLLENFSCETDGLNKARRGALQAYLDHAWEDFLKQTIVRACADETPKYSRKPIPPPLVAALRVLTRNAITAFLTIRKEMNEAAYHLLQQYDLALKQIKQSRRAVTFEDIASKLSQWMRESAAPSQAQQEGGAMNSIAHRMDCAIDHLLLDEFQDTSPNQWEIVKPFALSIVEMSRDPHRATSFFCVGDSKQAIYAWRGGVSEIFESVGSQIRNVQSETLALSRRSSPVVIDFVNDVFRRIALHPNYLKDELSDGKQTSHPTVEKWVEKYFQDHGTVHANLPGYVEFRNVGGGEEPGEDGARVSGALHREVARQVAELHFRAPHVTIGILTRTNPEIGSLITMLRELRVEASQEGGNPLIDTAPVLVILSALQLANHPGDSRAHFHVLNSPLKDQWSENVRNEAPLLSEAIRHALDHSGFGLTISGMANFLAPHCNARDQQRLQQFVEEAYRFASFGRWHIHEFLEFIETHRVALPSESKVRVMTIHQAKGLEFDAVFLPSLDESIVSRTPAYLVMRPDRTQPPIGIMRYMSRELQQYLELPWQIAFRESAEQQLGEALCLFYVALTRARQALYLIASPAKNAVKRWGSVLHTLYANEEQKNQPGALLYQSGDPEWYAATAHEDSDSEQAELPPRTCLRLAIHCSDLEHAPDNVVAPSHPIPERKIDLSELWKPEESHGAVIGKLVHRWFEEIHGWIEDFVPNKKRLTAIAASALTQEEMAQIRIPEWVDRFIAFCKMSSIRQVLSRDRYADWNRPKVLRIDVTNERRLLQWSDRQLVHGIIDRCVLGYDGDRVVRAEILDFKTDSRQEGEDREAWVQDRAARHAPQLQAYGRVLCEQFALRPDQVALTLVLLSENQLVPIPLHA